MTASGSAVPLDFSSAVALERRRKDWPTLVALVISTLVFCGLSIYLAKASESDLEADATTHFLIARYAPKQIENFVGVWGRPLCTCVYAITAHIGTVDEGRFATRLLSLALAMGVAAATYAIGKRQGLKRPAIVVILLFAQPLFFLHSFSELTEIPFAVVLMLAFLAYQRREFLLMAAAVSILPLGRPEGLGFIMMAAVALVMHRRWYWLPILAVPFVAWNWAGWYLTTNHVGSSFAQLFLNDDWWRWVVRNNPYSYQSMYGRGHPLAYIARLPVLTSPLVLPFMLAGTVMAVLYAKRLLEPSPVHNDAERQAVRNEHHLERCEALIALIPWSILAVHSVLWWKGKMGSSGDLRYLLIVGPFFALLGARGWEWAWARFQWRLPHLFAGLAALIPAGTNFLHGQQVVPFPMYADGLVSREAAQWYQSDAAIRKDFPKIMPTLPGVFYAMDVSATDITRAVPSCKKFVKEPPLGAVLVWDPIFGTANSSAEMCVTQDEIHANGWIHYRHFQVDDTYCEVYLSPRTANGEETRLKYKGDWEGLNGFELPVKFPGVE